jgi:lysophospholipase L1-like esterase
MVALWDDLDPWRGYFGTDTRAHSLLVGVLLGVVLVGRPVQRGAAARWAAAGAIVGALVLGAAVATSHESSSGLQHGGFLGVAVATAAVIAGSERVQPLNWVLTRRVLVGLGLISYGVYLWHWPVIVILDEPRTGLEGLPLALLRIGVTLTVALASYVLVEQPIRRSRRARVPARVGVAMSAAGVGTVAAFVLLATVVPPVPPAPPRTTTSLSAEVAAANELPVPMLMFGDSVARSLAGGGGDFKEWVPEQSVFDPTLVQLWNVATIYCSFLDGYQVMGDGRTNENAVFLCGDWKRWVEEVLVTDDYKFVLVALANDAGPRLVDDEVVELGTPGHQALLDDFLDELRSVSNQHGAELAVITLPPRTQRGTTVIDEDEDRERLMREEIRRYAEDRPGIRVLDLFEEICPNSECYSPEFDPSWRTDGLHYSTEGARWVADWITEQLVDVDAPASSSAAASRSVAPR